VPIGLGIKQRFGVGGFNPIQLSGNVFLLDANLGITLNGSNVSAWADQSGTGDANKNLAQATGGLQPPYVASDAAFNGQAAVGNFGGTTILPPVGNWSTGPPSTGTLFIVMRTGGAGLEIAFQNNGANNYEFYQNSSTTNLHWFQSGDAGVTVANMNNTHVYCIDMNGNSTQLYQDNITTSAGTLAAGSVSPTGITVGGHAGGFFVGKIPYMLINSTRLGAGQRGQTMNYLGTRYGVAITP
jgi:hypothetical protein